MIIPENTSEITLDQMQRIAKTEDAFEIVAIVTNYSVNEIKQMYYKDFVEVSGLIEKAIQTKGDFKTRFKLKGIEFGFIPNFDKIKAKEYFDLTSYADDFDNMHRLMAILYRPIVDVGKGNTYVIQEYNGTEDYCEIMKEMPMSYVDGAIGFFLTLSQELKVYIEKSTREVQRRKAMGTSKSGIGTLLLTYLRKARFGGMTIF